HKTQVESNRCPDAALLFLEDIIGEGGFGVVAKCRNTDTNKTVAIKINKSEAGILQQAVEEIAILKRLRCLNPDTCNIVRWDGFFFHKENICMTFELLDQSLYHYLQEQHTRGLTMGELKPILHQLATALAHLHSTETVHADLKPVNVMVVNRDQHPIQVKLIDFGLACPVSEVKQGACFGTVWYSAPEMLLGVPFKESFDMWSLGLIMAELILGCHLYPGKTVYDVLRFMVETQGQTPRWRFKSPEDMYYQYGFYASDTRDIKLKSLDEIEQYMEQDVELEKDRKMLVSLIKSMLNMDASKRIMAREVLQHPFFDPSIPESSSANAGEILAHTENHEGNTSPSISCRRQREFNRRILHPVTFCCGL
uniref:Protein kinase domain-containing protein n=1 Tax=Amphiprion percula TaxID=161767 RepID=A0A3P8U941_AMPPE